MQLHNITRKHLNQKPKTVGRGGTRGKTSGRGTKGQNARAGHKKRPEIRDTIKKFPKLRGRGINGLKTIQRVAAVVNVGDLERLYSGGMMVTPLTLRDHKLIRSSIGTRLIIKILGGGDLSKALIVKDCLVTPAAKEKIVKAGGSVA